MTITKPNKLEITLTQIKKNIDKLPHEKENT